MNDQERVNQAVRDTLIFMRLEAVVKSHRFIPLTPSVRKNYKEMQKIAAKYPDIRELSTVIKLYEAIFR